MWLLIGLLLLGDVVVTYCWLRERRAHRMSRRALRFWRTYREGQGRPTTVQARDLDTDHGMAAVREIIQRKVAAHRATPGDAA